MAVCNLPGVQYAFTEVDFMNGEHKTPELIHKRNPFGAIPVVVDNDGTRLFESRAISRYLVAKYAKGYYLTQNMNTLTGDSSKLQALSILLSILMREN
ncbi:hypothetical protein RhiTH_007452 [Rhizoctonia solani]